MALQKGRKIISPEHRLKLSLAMKGKTNNKGKHWKLSIEAKKNISLGHKGIKFTDEWRKNLSIASKGHHRGIGRKWNDNQRQARAKMKGVLRPQFSGINAPRYIDGRCKDPKYLSWIKNKRNRDKRANGGTHTFEQWEALKAKYAWMCLCCKKHEPEIKLTEDHIIPVSKGGNDDILNIQPLCLLCNMRKHVNIINYIDSI